MRPDVLRAVSVNVSVFRNVMLCDVLESNGYFGRILRFILELEYFEFEECMGKSEHEESNNIYKANIL